MSTPRENYDSAQLAALIMASLEQSASPADIRQLNDLLRNHPDACRFYLEFIETHAAIRQITETLILSDKTTLDQTAFRETVKKDLEDSAIRRAIALAEGGDESETKPESPAVLNRRTLTAADWRRLLVKSAAIIVLCLSILWLDRWIMRESAIQPRLVVARLADQVNAQWDNDRRLPHPDGRMTQDTYRLTQGYARICFDKGAQVVIEAPSELALLDEDSMQLLRGRAYATVPVRAIGFTVKAGNARIIDLGTEFGIKVDDSLNTQLHVIKGRTILFWGLDQGDKAQAEVSQGQARLVDQAGGNVHTITLEQETFVRDISGPSGMVWRGQSSINLADIVCGGDGFGSGNPDMTLDPTTGNLINYVERSSSTRLAEKSYCPVKSLPFVDGVFVPNSDKGAIIVSSQGTEFANGPKTSGRVRKDITVLNKTYQAESGNLSSNGKSFGHPFQPAISIHANIGITFDLDAIRKNLPANTTISALNALCAIAPYSGTKAEESSGKSDFWILLDGREQKSITGVYPGFAEQIQIPIGPEAHFLTIMTTDHYGENQQDPINSDRCFLGNPVLSLVSRP